MKDSVKEFFIGLILIFILSVIAAAWGVYGVSKGWW